LERPAAADIETALRQALVSPASTPGELVPETTRVLPAMPFHPPSITAEESVEELREAAGSADGTSSMTPGSGNKGRQSGKKLSAKSRRRRIWLLALLGIVVLAAAVSVVLVSLSAKSIPDIVPYPTVTGVLGDHLEELQKSVQP
jgi:hypothetical protein